MPISGVNKKGKHQMINNLHPKSLNNYELYNCLSQFDSTQLKLFFSVFVHYWMNHKLFISNQNFFNLWCELNQFCHEVDESFPDQYNDYEEIRTFCQMHPYYFIDKLPIALIAKLVTEHVDNHIDILLNIVKILYETDVRTVYTYANKSLGLNESVDILVSETIDHIKSFS